MIKNEPKKEGKISSEDFDVRAMIGRFIFHWPLYLLVFIISTIAAYLYLRYTRPVYSATGEIYIKEDKGNSSGGQSILADLDMFSSNKIVENEMEVIKSPLILEDVIRENKFNVKYFLKGKVLNLELYKKSPLQLNILSDSSRVGKYLFKVTLLENDKVKVSYPMDVIKMKNYRTLFTRLNKPFQVKKDMFSIGLVPTFLSSEDKEFEIQVDSILPLVYKKSQEISTTLINRVGTVFKLTYEDEMAERSADFLNAILNTYNKYTLTDKNQTTLSTINFIESRLASLGNELDILERDVERFKKVRGITEIDESSKLILDQAREADKALNQSEIQLSVYNDIEKYLNNPQKGKPFSPVFGMVDPALSALINRYEETLREKSKLSLAVQPGNPLLTEVEDQVANTKKSIKEYIEGYRRNALIEKTGAQKNVSQIETRINKIPTYEREFINLKRQQSIKEGLFTFLLQRKEESAVSYASNIVTNKIISPAYFETDPIRPKKPLIYLLFVFLGTILCSGYLWLKYLFNNNITSKKDIEKITKVPIVADIYKYDIPKLLKLNDRTVLSEQILNLRNNLKFLLAGRDQTQAPAILFTSSMSGEGKTFISSHLGNALTYNNKKVILLEFDLRKPKLSQSLGISNSSGVTNYLVGVETLEQVIKKIPENDNLFIIPSGPIPPNPVELIESEAMKQLFVILRQRFDYIIIDTSPVGMVSDAKSLSPLVDCALYIVRFNYTPKAKFNEVINDIDLSIFPKLGLVFNGVDLETSYGYNSYGYNVYGYGYGNNLPEKSRIKSFIKNFRQRTF